MEKCLFTRRKLLGTALASGVMAGRASAQGDLPNTPITLVVPFAAGGATDVVSRIVGKALSERIGRSVVIENLKRTPTVVYPAEVASAAPVLPLPPWQGRS